MKTKNASAATDEDTIADAVNDAVDVIARNKLVRRPLGGGPRPDPEVMAQFYEGIAAELTDRAENIRESIREKGSK